MGVALRHGRNRAAILLPRFSAAALPAPMRIGHITLANRLFAAPMAGVTDRPFRQLCKRLGAGYAVSEMVTSRKDLWASAEDQPARRPRRRDRPDLGADRRHRRADDGRGRAPTTSTRGAQIIDINMGCPAKKVCNKWAGSALMKDEPLALAIVEAVVARVRAARRAGDAEDAHRLVREREERGAHRARRRSRRHRHGRGARPHPRAGLQGRRPSTRPSLPSSARCAIPVVANGDIDSPAEGARGVRRDRRRRDHDRPRRAGPALDLRRHRPLPRDRRARAAAAGRRRQGLAARAPRRPLPPLRRVRRRAQRAQAHRLDVARPARRRGVPRRDERDRDRATRRSRAVGDWFDRLADTHAAHARRAAAPAARRSADDKTRMRGSA